jgi:hypothetical protein
MMCNNNNAGSATLFDTLTKQDVLDAAHGCADVGASGTTYACNLSPAITAYVTGIGYRFKPNTTNTGASTINFNSLGAKTIKKAAGGITTDLAANDMRAGQWVDLVYDGTNMQMQSTLGNAAAGGTNALAPLAKTANYTSVAADFTTPSIITFTCTAACTYTLVASAPASGGYVVVQNNATFPLTITPNGLTLDGSSANIFLGFKRGIVIASNGSNYVTGADQTNVTDVTTSFIADDFNQGTTINGQLGWVCFNGSGTGSCVENVSTYPHIGVFNDQSGATSGNWSALELTGGNTSRTGDLSTNTNWEVTYIFQLAATTNDIFYAGLASTDGTLNPANLIAVRYDTNCTVADTAFTVVVKSGGATGAGGCTGAGITVGGTTYTVDTNWHKIVMKSTTATQVTFIFDNNAPQTLTTNVPTANLFPQFLIGTTAAAAKNANIDYFAFAYRGLSR